MRQNRTRKPEPAPLKRLLLVQIHGRPDTPGRKELLGHAAEAAQPGIGTARYILVLPRRRATARLRHQRFVHIGEAGLVLQETQIDIRDRTVTVLGDDDLGHTRRSAYPFSS